MDKNTILKFKYNVLKRYEASIDVFFLLNLETDEIWTGNFASYVLLSQIKEPLAIFDIIKNAKSYFEDYSEEDLVSSIVEVASELVEKGFMEICE